MSYGDTDCSVCVCVCVCVSMPLYQLGLFSADTDAHNITRPFSRFPSLSLSLSLSLLWRALPLPRFSPLSRLSSSALHLLLPSCLIILRLRAALRPRQVMLHGGAHRWVIKARRREDRSGLFFSSGNTH